jgi:hypothetical protein
LSVTYRDMTCTPGQVFAVLSDGWLLGLWVVGASRIRDVDATWPAPGATVHHSVGSWPALLDDTTTVKAVVPDRSLGLQARAWPAGEANVLIQVDARPGGCRVTITEDAVKGPATWLPKPVRSALLHRRNTEALRRLEYLAEGRTAPSMIVEM